MRRAWIGLCVLLLLGCQAPAASSSQSVAAPPPVAPQAAEPAAATDMTSVWGEVAKQCACHAEREPLARVSSDFQVAQLPVDFKVESAMGGWELFSVTFDPARVSSDQVAQIMKDAGALVIPAPY
jgi:hypothetical protein